MYDLICEGACNPDIGLVDKLASRYMSERMADLAVRHRPDDLVTLQRMLQYTPHVVDGDPRFAICGVCMTRRKFGA